MALAALFGLASILAAGPLRAQEESLETIIITEGRIPQALSEITKSVDVATGEEIRGSGASNLADYMGRLGFQVRSARGANYGEETITIRGLSTSVFGTDINTDILVLIDGRRTGSDSLSLIDLNMIDRVEVIRGPGAVQYGSAAMSGVVNVITVRGSDIPKARIEAGFGSFKRRQASASGAVKKGAFDLAGGLSYAQAGDYKDGRGRLWPHSSMGGKTSWLARAGYSFGENESHRLGITIQGARLNNLGGLIGSSASSLRSYVQYQDKFMDSIEALYEGRAPDCGLSWQARWFGGQTGYALNRHPGLAGRPEPSYVGAETTNKFQGAQAQVAWDGERLSLVGGADWLHYDFLQLQAETSGSPETTGQSLYQNLGLYLLFKLKPLGTDKLIVSAGLRSDQYEVKVDNLKAAFGLTPEERSQASLSFKKILPSVGLAWNPIPELKLRANYALAYKVPTPRQLTGNYYMGSTLFLGDMAIKPETSRNLDFGADLTLGFLAASLSYFHTDYDNLISFRRISNSPPVSQYLNVEEAVIDGIELKLASDLAPYLSIPGTLRPYLSLTRLFKYQSRDGRLLPDVARDSLGAGIDFSLPGPGLSISLDATYLGAINVAGSYTNQTPSGRTGGVTIWDLSASKRLGEFGGGELKAKLTLKNFLDKQYDTSDGDVMPGASYRLSLIWEL
ncbi:MAG: TonB-dependent receptor [Deltaproteobacteria bacterium]|nr:TonB-dependent receptor [Deltaproteobacteria bacterium]